MSMILLENVRVFDGIHDQLTDITSVLVENNFIKEISPNGTAADNATIIDGGGRVLMPGLIEAHGHLSLNTNPVEIGNRRTWDYIGVLMGKEAERYLMRGFTTVRDAGGPVFGLKQAIDEGLVNGPRIFPSGAVISQTSGHGDFRNYNGTSSYFTGVKYNFTELGFCFLADGVTEVQKAVRENLRMQASQIKVMAGGGVTSFYDPLDITQYTLEETKTAVAEAERWGTYVMTHTYTDHAINQALDAGVKCIEHGMLIKEDTMKRIADVGAWLSLQAFLVLLPVEKNPMLSSPAQRTKMQQVQDAAKNEFQWASDYGVKVAWGTDLFGARQAYDNVMNEFAFRAPFFSHGEQLKQVTGNNGELLSLSGIRNPYPEGKLGVIEPGAYADLLIVEGNPLEDIRVMMNPEDNLKLIAKDGKVYKNTLLN